MHIGRFFKLNRALFVWDRGVRTCGCMMRDKHVTGQLGYHVAPPNKPVVIFKGISSRRLLPRRDAELAISTGRIRGDVSHKIPVISETLPMHVSLTAVAPRVFTC